MNTILAIPLKEVFVQTAEKFKRLFPDKHIGMVGNGIRDISEDITITTFKSLRSCAIEKCQLLLVDELQSASGDEVTTTICSMNPIRVFGYTATDQGMFNKSEKLLKGIFGERLIFVPYQEAEQVDAVVPVTAWFIRVPPEGNCVPYSTLEGKLRHGIKNCRQRNELIGAVCRAVPHNWQTLVFVDHIRDHLVPLMQFMPQGTSYIHRNPSKAELGEWAMSPSRQRKAIEEFQSNDRQFLIATDAFRAGVDIPNCRVVVQASGGTSEVELLQEAYRGSRILPKGLQESLGVTPKTHAVLIDFLDAHDSALEAMSRKRMSIYQSQGWEVREIDDPSQIDWNFYKTVVKGQ